MDHDRGTYVVAVLAALLVYVAASGIELAVIASLQPTEIELTWISDAILSVSLGVAIFLWLRLKRTRQALSRLEHDHIVLDTQLSMAAEIQRNLLPPDPESSGAIQWAARLEPAQRIGGDLYDFVPVDPGSWLVLVGDVSGKGVPAALVLASVRTMFRIMAAETVDPGTLVERLSQTLYDDNRGALYLTCLVARVEAPARRLAYVNAGHPAGRLLDPSDPTRQRGRLDSGGPPAGLFRGQRYTTATVSLPSPVLGVLMTDGVTEAIDEIGLDGSDPVAAALAQLPRPVTPHRACDTLMAATAPAFGHDRAGWQDDRTIVAFTLPA